MALHIEYKGNVPYVYIADGPTETFKQLVAGLTTYAAKIAANNPNINPEDIINTLAETAKKQMSKTTVISMDADIINKQGGQN